MLAVDTNLLVRFLTDDDPTQSKRVKGVFGSSDIFISATVILETAWVLKRILKLSSEDICEAFASLSGLAGIQFEHPGRLTNAIAWTRQGMQFADALHLAASAECEAFLSFDKDLAKTAARIGAFPVREP